MTVIDDYLKNLKQPEKVELERVREIVKKTVRGAEETIGYGMPVLKYKGKYVIGFAAFKDHLSIFPGAFSAEELKDELEGFKTSKGTIQFTLNNQIPESVITKLVSSRIENIDS